VCRGYKPVGPRCDQAETRTSRATADVAHRLPPAVASQARRTVRYVVFVRPEGRPPRSPPHLLAETRICCVSCRLKRVGPCRPESKLSAARHTGVRRSVLRGAPTGPSVRSGFPVRAPSLHRCLSIDSYPGVRIARFRPCRQRSACHRKQWSRPAPIDSKALLNRRVRNVNHRFQCLTPYTSMGFVPLRGLTSPPGACPTLLGAWLTIPLRLHLAAVGESVRSVRWPLPAACKHAAVRGRPPWGL
jgi:hypothetical protein